MKAQLEQSIEQQRSELTMRDIYIKQLTRQTANNTTQFGKCADAIGQQNAAHQQSDGGGGESTQNQQGMCRGCRRIEKNNRILAFWSLGFSLSKEDQLVPHPDQFPRIVRYTPKKYSKNLRNKSLKAFQHFLNNFFLRGHNDTKKIPVIFI